MISILLVNFILSSNIVTLSPQLGLAQAKAQDRVTWGHTKALCPS